MIKKDGIITIISMEPNRLLKMSINSYKDHINLIKVILFLS